MDVTLSLENSHYSPPTAPAPTPTRPHRPHRPRRPHRLVVLLDLLLLIVLGVLGVLIVVVVLLLLVLVLVLRLQEVLLAFDQLKIGRKGDLRVKVNEAPSDENTMLDGSTYHG